MAKDSLILDVNNEMWDLPMYGSMPAIGIKMIVIFNKEFKRVCKEGKIDENQFLQAIDVAYYYTINLKFPTPIKGVSFIDFKFEKCEKYKDV